MRHACLMISSLAAMLLAGCSGSRIPVASGSVAFTPPLMGGAAATSGLVSQANVRLSRADLASALAAEQRALEAAPAGQPVEWQGSGGSSGTVIAAQPYRVGSQDCRPYSHVVRAGGPAQSLRGTACRNPDGTWSLLN
ncbi:hypothetical protein GCM10023174_01680 [Chelativorans composti]|uniref:Surface antigen n=1 Tax=Chelativorans composti TaxID=768533 RepID=A0ABW5DFM8_9HYPH